jgi:Holliday junction resolvasome RuvABC endonuclease subunit
MYIFAMTTVLALDISSASTGICVYKDGDILYNEAVRLKQKSHAERLLIFEVALKAIISTYNPDIIAIEDCWQGSNRKTFKVLALYHGVAYKICYETTRKEPFVIMPSEVRKCIGHYAKVELISSKKRGLRRGDGSDSKKLTYDFIVKLFSLKEYTFENNNDQTDAIAVALAYSLVSGNEQTRSIFDTGAETGSSGRGRKKGVPKSSISASPGPKPRKQRVRRKV